MVLPPPSTLEKKTGQEVAPCYHRNKDMPGGWGRNQSSLGCSKWLDFQKGNLLNLPINHPKWLAMGKSPHFFGNRRYISSFMLGIFQLPCFFGPLVGWYVFPLQAKSQEESPEKSLKTIRFHSQNSCFSLTECNTRNVDGSEILHLSRLVVYPIIYTVFIFFTSQVQDSSINSMIKQFCSFTFFGIPIFDLWLDGFF